MAYTLITGASGGIGREMARECAAHGHDLVLVARSEGKLGELADRLHNEHGVDARVYACDLSVSDAAIELYERIRTDGLAVNRLVNSAGFGDQGAFLDADWSRQADMVQLNVTALMQMTYLYGLDMRDAGFGRILNLSSVAAFSAGPYMSIYYATKGFVLSFSQAVNAELSGSGVTVTALCPGPTATGFERAAQMGGSKMFTFFRPATPEQVAAAGYKSMEAGRPIAYHSAATKVMNVGARLLPRSVANRFAEAINGRGD
ncbi:MAG: SDR family oxidoreductase [Eggerthellaceae bacterium]